MIFNSADNIMIGNTEVLKVYAGDNEVWTRGGFRELRGVPPLSFRGNGTILLDWSITGAAGGVGNLGNNKLNYKPIVEGELTNNVNPQSYPEDFCYIYTVSDAGTAGVLNGISIPNGDATAEYQRWYFISCIVNDYWHKVRDYRTKAYNSCNWKGYLQPGTYKLICECGNPYYELSSNNPNPTMIDEHAYYCLMDDDNNIIVNVLWEDFVTAENENSNFIRKETEFIINEPTNVGLLSKMYRVKANDNIVNVAWRFMIVPANTENINFSADTSLPGVTIAGVSCWEPYRFIIPVVVSSGDQITTIDIYVDEALGANDTLAMEAAGVALPTYVGVTTININTDITPSEMYIKYSL